MAIEELATLSSEFRHQREAFANKAKEILQRAFAEYFDKHGAEVASLRWSQYTPYFNDGEACVFGVNDIRIVLADTPESDDDDDWEEGESIPWRESERLLRHVDALAIGSFLDENPEIAEASYGDHVEVVVTKNGVEVEEYCHD
jgi:hypothetical protein